ncbi:MAG TPA: hypothetical protein DCW55_04075 [Candidatus Pacebacteria bacterium]|nr:MAG: hypothetical protein A2378_01940 [Candidatus Pacebacteria bacterium RIFOXYB1_FULL_44_10]HAU99380.1 hypothetical protein [Candidatus Paceibacterota bacterium]HAX01615.1 hypothetical protein [Candidatus Paceibacterota bacterium]
MKNFTMSDSLRLVLFSATWFSVALFCFSLSVTSALLLRRRVPIAVSPSSTLRLATAETTPNTTRIGLSSEIVSDDARVEIVTQFLTRHNSPMEPRERYAKALVEVADRHGIDYRLLPAIMMQESNLCKNIPEGSYNCAGFGIHARGTLGFASYEEGFERMAKELKKNYIDIGLTTPEKIMKKYTPHSDGSWANSVNQWIAEMEYNDRSLGKSMKSDADLTVYPSTTPVATTE